LDTGRVASASEVAAALTAGADRATAAGVTGPLFLDCLAFPAATDPARYRRSIEVARALAGGSARPLVAVGNVGHGAAGRLRRWLRLVYVALALGAGAGALILPVTETALIDAVDLIEARRAAAHDLEHWLLSLAEAGRDGTWPPPPPPAGAADALREAWRLARR
jgi:hypothetical protein